jgi:excisionase family DNA binding protein
MSFLRRNYHKTAIRISWMSGLGDYGIICSGLNCLNWGCGRRQAERLGVAEKRLTTRAVAEILGVSEATIKRWADEKLIRAERTAGGHRRFRVPDVGRFMRSRNTEGKPLAALLTEEADPSSPDALRVSSRLFFDALLEGREDDSAAFLIQPYLQGRQLTEIFDRLFCQTMNLIGELWYRGELTIAEEHLATHTAMSALRALRNVINAAEPNSLSAICCSVEDDFHELPVYLAQIVFEAEAWRVVNLGANTPFFALEEAVGRYHPLVVCISSTILFHRDRNAHDYKAFHQLVQRMGIAVVLGGRGFTADEGVRGTFQADLHAESFSQLQEFLSTRQGGNEHEGSGYGRDGRDR